jgi:Mn-containing catalase
MRAYVVKGSDVYLKSEVVAEVQHYVKQVMSYDPEIGWGADWTGDYILADGEFIPVNAEEE